MATGDNPTIPLYEPGSRITAAATAAIVSGKFVKISGTFQGGPLLSVSAPLTGGNLPQVATCTAGAKALGVAGADASGSGEILPVLCGHDMVVPMIAGTAGLTAGVEVESDASGNPITLASGRPSGMALSTATAGNVVYIRLY